MKKIDIEYVIFWIIGSGIIVLLVLLEVHIIREEPKEPAVTTHSVVDTDSIIKQTIIINKDTLPFYLMYYQNGDIFYSDQNGKHLIIKNK